jgi:uncharacterized membrane protein YkoI
MPNIHPFTSIVSSVVVTAILCGVPQAFAEAAPAKPKTSISLAQAERIALERVPGGTIEEAERDRHAGREVYEIDVRDSQGRDHELVIDATDGRVISDVIDD